MDRAKTQLYQAGSLPQALGRPLTKTRIFHGLPASTRATPTQAAAPDPESVPTVLLDAAPFLAAQGLSTESTPTTEVACASRLEASEPDSVRERRTRLLPIEQLLEPGKRTPAARPSSPAERAHGLIAWWRRRSSSALARGRVVRLAVGAAALAFSGYVSIAEVGASRAGPPAEPIATERDIAERVVAAQPVPDPAVPERALDQRAAAERPASERPFDKPPVPERPVPEPPIARRTHDAAPSREPARTRSVDRQSVARQGPSDRKACDYLAAGDLARAAKTYAQLAKRSPDAVVYAEAARILRARLERSAP